MDKLKELLKPLARIARLLALATAVGLGMGLAGSAFGLALHWAADTFAQQGWLLYLLPLAGVAIVGFYRLCRVEEDKGTDLVLITVREQQSLPLRMAPLIFTGTVLTHLFGGSAGREGAALQLGGSLAAGLGRLLKLDRKDNRGVIMCGMAAGFAALFGTPLAAAIFALEVVSVGMMYYSALLPCLVSALLGYQVSLWCGLSPTRFPLAGTPPTGLLSWAQAMGMGLLCAVLAFFFCKLLHGAHKLYGKAIPNPYLRAAVGGALVVALTLLVGNRDYNGAGGAVIAAATSGEPIVPYAFVLKMLFTALTLGAGFKGGEIVPALFTGATFGAAVGPLMGLSSAWGAGLGMIALFCGVTNCPLTSFLLAFELFGGEGMIPFALCAGVSYLCSGYTGLYTEQRIVYGKHRAEYVNKKAE